MHILLYKQLRLYIDLYIREAAHFSIAQWQWQFIFHLYFSNQLENSVASQLLSDIKCAQIFSLVVKKSPIRYTNCEASKSYAV